MKNLLIILAALTLAGCSIDDHSVRPAPDPISLAVPLVLLILLFALALSAMMLPAVLDHRRQMRELELRERSAAMGEALQYQMAIQLSRQMGWPLALALQHVRAAAQLGSGGHHDLYQ